VKVIEQFETSGLSLGFHNWDMEFKNWSAKAGIQMMFIDVVILSVVGIYMEAVMPKTYGKPLHPCFMFLPSFWCKSRKRLADER
jgi:hypothetical protein